MAGLPKILSSSSVDESWGPAFKEAGLDFSTFGNFDEALKGRADCYLLDIRDMERGKNFAQLREKTAAPIFTLVRDSVGKRELQELRKRGAFELVSEKTPAEELAVRVASILKGEDQDQAREFRGARRVWFQQDVQFTVFDKPHQAWSTTLSETGVFLHTTLSFPLYSVVKLKFNLLGESSPFVCEGVIVRQEVESKIRGIGVMFQNLSGEQIRSLEAFLEICR
jgi:hypothetical protein